MTQGDLFQKENSLISGDQGGRIRSKLYFY